MRTFNLCIHDIRYAGPTRELATAPDPAGAKRLAQERLWESPYHLGVEVRDDEEELIFWLRRMQPSGDAAAQFASL